MGSIDFGERLASVLRSWDGVIAMPHRSGGVEFRVGRREIGHVHVGGVADLLLSVRMRRDLVAAGRAEAHHTLPHSGWISFRMRTEHDLPAAVALFRLNYDRIRGITTRPGTPIATLSSTAVLLNDRTADDMPA